MKVTIAGSGYVGLVSGACLAEVGNKVLCLDLNQNNIQAKLTISRHCEPSVAIDPAHRSPRCYGEKTAMRLAQ